MNDRTRHVVVGTGARSRLFIDAILKKYSDAHQIVGLCDTSKVRMHWHRQRIQREYGIEQIPIFHADDFDQMIEETGAQSVIVCSVDATHDHYVTRAMELGCDVICEKPLTTTAGKARRILAAVQKTGRQLRVGLNCRYMPEMLRVKQLVDQETIGRPLKVDLCWMLDTRHGADYFRRWHRQKQYSGGLLVHKASHHFDLVNWWISSSPRVVQAMGDLSFYGRDNAYRRGEQYAYDRYTGHVRPEDDPFALLLDEGYDAPSLKGLYLDAEKETGYIRDRNVFGDGIDIEDRMTVIVRYNNGVLLSYSLVAFSPWEGLRLSITGDRGRIELDNRFGAHIVAGQSDDDLASTQSSGTDQSLRVLPMFGQPYDVEVPKGEGSHGGGDRGLLANLFGPAADQQPDDPRPADHRDGLWSAMVGIAANEAMSSGGAIDCHQLIGEAVGSLLNDRTEGQTSRNPVIEIVNNQPPCPDRSR
jgi:predicted dehydrogenase